MLSLLKALPDYSLASTSGFPYDVSIYKEKKKEYVVAVELEDNVAELHEYLFDETDYVPSSTVQSISSTIVDKTGVKEGSAIYNTDAYNETVGVDGTSDLK